MSNKYIFMFLCIIHDPVVIINAESFGQPNPDGFLQIFYSTYILRIFLQLIHH